MANSLSEVPVDQLRARIDTEKLPFETTKELSPPEEGVIGQERAIEAIKFGMGMKDLGYNIFVAGPPQTGLTYIAKTFLERVAKTEPTPPDWCYVYNFKEPDKPKSLKLSAGKGKVLKKDMAELVRSLQNRIPEVFDSDDYHNQEKELKQEFEAKRRQIVQELSDEAKNEGFILQFSQVGMVIVPAKDDEPMSQEEIAQLSEEEKKELKERSEKFHKKMSEAIKQIRKAENEYREKQTKLDNDTALYVVGHLIETYKEKYKDEEQVLSYLDSVQEDVLENIDDFKKKQDQQQALPLPIPPKENAFRRYDVNVLIDNSEREGAPVIIESNPVYPNLFGSIERQAWFGALVTDFTMIKAGALHRANGGYLVIKALDLLKWYLSWEALKRAIKNKEIKIEDLGELYGLFSTRTIQPEPIPLDVKLVLTGDHYLYQLLYIYDDQFPKMFKVKAHLDDQITRDENMVLQCASCIAKFCDEEKIRHLDRTGVARVLEYSMELTEDWEKLTLRLGQIGDVIKEANYWASQDNAEFITADHVEKAIEKKIYRANLVEERVKELVTRDIFWVETDGYITGQVNGISILMLGDHEFGKPNRITVTVAVGKEGVIAIDRESKLSGNIYNKAILILSSYLKEKFAHNKPISLTASICFEQSYSKVEGDSASSAELFALLSAIANVPIYQGIAVTGSVSQKGEIQPVGGVTKKIEGFFDICKSKGLTGKQGVIIPEKNVKNLMLKKEIIEAAKEGKFHIYPIKTVEEGVEILMGMKAGQLQEDGTYPEDTLFARVDARLRELTEIAREYGKSKDDSEKEEKDTYQ